MAAHAADKIRPCGVRVAVMLVIPVHHAPRALDPEDRMFLTVIGAHSQNYRSERRVKSTCGSIDPAHRSKLHMDWNGS
jgi:hypothetical protein